MVEQTETVEFCQERMETELPQIAKNREMFFPFYYGTLKSGDENCLSLRHKTIKRDTFDKKVNLEPAIL